MATVRTATPYNKPYLSVAEQVILLTRRGMIISNRASAELCLSRIGYFRLSGYWYPFRKSHVASNPLTGTVLIDPRTRRPQVVVEDDFRTGTTFAEVMDLYVFDKRLRLLILDAVERVEIALRVDIALLLGARSPLAHRDANELHGNFARKVGANGRTAHEEWLDTLDKNFRRSSDEFVTHFKRKYTGVHAPIWIAIELWDFGMLSRFFAGMRYADQATISLRYGMSRPEMLANWIRNINHIRNICAHHGRLWNRSPADQVSAPKSGDIPILSHLSGNPETTSRLYATCAVLQYLLRTIHPGSTWGARLEQHMGTLPLNPVINLSQSGFPRDWKNLALWH